MNTNRIENPIKVITNTPSPRIERAGQALIAIEREIRSGNYTDETLYRYDRAYNDYIRANFPAEKPPILQRIRERLGFR